MAPTWESLKEAIRELYLVQNESKDRVISELRRRYGFTATEAQYERQLKKWNFRKSLTAKEWAQVARRVEKRKREGRDSDVILNGNCVPAQKLQKKASTFGYQTTWDKLQASLQASDCRSPTPEGIAIFTPPASPVNKSQTHVKNIPVPSPARTSISWSAVHSTDTLRKQSTYLTRPEQGNVYPDDIVIALAKAVSAQDLQNSDMLSWLSQKESGRRESLLLTLELKSQPQTPTASQLESLARDVLQEAILVKDLKFVAQIIAHCKQDIVNMRTKEAHNSRLPIEVSICSGNLAATKLMICCGARLEDITLEAIGIKNISVDYSPDYAFSRDQRVAQAKEIFHHLSESGFQRIPPVLQFHVSLIAGVATAVKSILRSAFKVHEVKGYKGHEALAIAARLGHTDVVRTLLDAGAPANQDFRCSTAICPPIFWAVKNGDVEMVDLLLQNGALTERPYCPRGSECTESYHEHYNSFVSTLPTVLQFSFAQENYRMAENLLVHGAVWNSEPVSKTKTSVFTRQFGDLAGKSALDIASENGQRRGCRSALIQSLLTAKFEALLPLSSLELSMDHGDPRKIELRLSHARPGSLSFLHAAAWKWDLSMLKLSLDEGADINGVNSKGWTALHTMFMNHARLDSIFYSFERFQPVWSFLMDHGAKINNPKPCVSLISTVVEMIVHQNQSVWRYEGLVDFLIGQGIVWDDPRALLKAVTHQVDWLADALLRARVNIPHLDHTALMVAVRNRDRQTVKKLLLWKESATQPCKRIKPNVGSLYSNTIAEFTKTRLAVIFLHLNN